MKESLEGEFMYRISIAFFLAFNVEESPVLGNSQSSIAFCFKSLALSLSFNERSSSKDNFKIQ